MGFTEDGRFTHEILVLGPERSGKTLLVNRLKMAANGSYNDLVTVPFKPTIGIERDVIEFEKQSMVVKEVGSAMRSTWNSYLPHCSMLLFTIDSANRVTLSMACSQLMMCVSQLSQAIPVVIVLTHMDAPEQLHQWEIDYILRLDDLKSSRGHVKVFAVNNINGQGISELVQEILNG